MAKPGAKTLKVTLVRSPIGTKQNHRQCVRGLGLRRLNQTVERPDDPSIRGMVAKIPHLVEVSR